MTTRNTGQHVVSGGRPRLAESVDLRCGKATRPGEVAVLDTMEAEHLRIDPAMSVVDASLAWMLDGASASTSTSRRLLGLLPPSTWLLYRAMWRPGYARTPRWGAASS